MVSANFRDLFTNPVQQCDFISETELIAISDPPTFSANINIVDDEIYFIKLNKKFDFNGKAINHVALLKPETSRSSLLVATIIGTDVLDV